MREAREWASIAQLCDLTATSRGPHGRSKVLLHGAGSVVVTSHSQRLLEPAGCARRARATRAPFFLRATTQCSLSVLSEAIDGSPGARILLELAKQQSCVCGDGGLLVLALGTHLVLRAQRDERSSNIKPAAVIEARAARVRAAVVALSTSSVMIACGPMQGYTEALRMAIAYLDSDAAPVVMRMPWSDVTGGQARAAATLLSALMFVCARFFLQDPSRSSSPCSGARLRHAGAKKLLARLFSKR